MTFYPRGTQALNIGIGYSYQKAKYDEWSKDDKKFLPINDDYHGLFFKLTYEINILSVK